MYTALNGIYEGEIVGVQPQVTEPASKTITYFCRVTLPNGSDIVVPNVVASSMFGGIDDYFQERARTSTDDGNSFEPSEDDESNHARIGARVYISFVAGNISKPVILAYMQHPNQTQEIPNDAPSPMAVLKYLGMRFEFNEAGVLRVTHFGAPAVEYVASAGLAGDLAGALDLVGGSESEEGIAADVSNPAVTPADASKRTYVEFKDAGGLEIRDSLNQIVFVDTEQGRIYIANNDVQGGPQIASNNTDSEYVLLDREKKLVLINARERITLYSFGERRDITEGDHKHKVIGNEEFSVGGARTDKVEGDFTRDVKGNCFFTTGGLYSMKATDGFSLDTDKLFNVDAKTVDITAKDHALIATSGAKLVLESASVALGAGGVEVLKTLSDTLKALSDTLLALTNLTVTTSNGPSGLPINAGDFANLVPTVEKLKGAIDGITGSL